MNYVFKELKDAGLVGIYLDDIIVPAKDWNEMLEVYERVFSAL